MAVVGAVPVGWHAVSGSFPPGVHRHRFRGAARCGRHDARGASTRSLAVELVVQREIDAIVSPDGDTPSRIELKLNHHVDDVEALLDEFDAVFCSHCAHAGVKLPYPGKRSAGRDDGHGVPSPGWPGK